MKSEHQYDVVISGAGPGGNMAAYVLARAGKKVLVLEKKKIPRDKTCSGVLSQAVINILEKEFEERIPWALCVWPYEGKGIKALMPGGRDFTFFTSYYLNIYRRYFDYWLNLKASAQGAVIWD